MLLPRLDALVSEANTKEVAESLEFANEKQRMLQRAKTAIRSVVEVFLRRLCKPCSHTNFVVEAEFAPLLAAVAEK